MTDDKFMDFCILDRGLRIVITLCEAEKFSKIKGFYWIRIRIEMREMIRLFKMVYIQTALL